MRRCGCDWPFHWIADVTTFDPATRIHQFVVTVHQSSARSLTEAAANARAMAKAIEAVAAVLDMSDPDHESFADSAADCLDALLAHEKEIRRILTALAVPPAASVAPPLRTFRTTGATTIKWTPLAATQRNTGLTA